MPRSFSPEASGSHLQKLLLYFGWPGLHNEMLEKHGVLSMFDTPIPLAKGTCRKCPLLTGSFPYH
jgi:hypothetical protein